MKPSFDRDKGHVSYPLLMTKVCTSLNEYTLISVTCKDG